MKAYMQNEYTTDLPDGFYLWAVSIGIPGSLRKGSLEKRVVAKSHQSAKDEWVKFTSRLSGDPNDDTKLRQHLKEGNIHARRITRILRPYFVYDTQPEYGAVLVFDYNVRDAKILGYKEFPSPDGDYIHFRCVRADDEYMFFSKSKKPHVVDSYDGNYDTWEIALEELSKNKTA